MLTFSLSPHGERFVRDLQRDDFVARPSCEVFADHFAIDFDADDTLFVIVGSDSGLLVRWLIDRTGGNGSFVLAVELDEHHDPITAELDGAPDAPHVRMCRASDTEQAMQAIEFDKWLIGGKVVLVESMACYLGRSEHYTDLARALKTLLAERTHRVKVSLNGRKFLQTGIRNLTENRRQAASVGAIGTGRTAVVLGGGPSLDDHLEWVSMQRDRLFVFAVARIVGKLNAAGIVPDAVVAVDPHDVFYDISKHALELRNTLLVNSYHVVPPLLQQWPGPSVYIGRAMAWPNSLTDDADNIMSQGSTVTHAALWVAHCWGFSQILLSGFDLCYAPGGATHASGSPESLAAGLTIGYEAQVPTYDGRRAGTATAFKLACDELENIGKAIAKDGTAVYNLAPGAARIESIEHRGVGDIVARGTRPPVPVADDNVNLKEYWRALNHELHTLGRGMRALRAGCRKAQILLDGLHGTGGQPPDPRCKRKLDTLERNLNRREGTWLNLVKGYAVLEFLGTIAPRGFETQTDDELEKWGREYYRIIDRSARELQHHATDASKRVEQRLEEQADAPDVAGLIDYWKRDRTVGRIRFALGTASLDASDRALIAEQERWLQDHLADTDTTRVQQISSQKNDPKLLLRTVALLFSEKQHDELAHLCQAFDRHGERYVSMADWAYGQLAELDDDIPAALDCYTAIARRHAGQLDTRTDEAAPIGQTSLFEDALLRITRLRLARNEPEHALDALVLLTRLSAAYGPRQATLLALLGRHDDALDLLQGLLQNGSKDWRIAEQLGQVYESIDATAAADVAYSLAKRLRGADSCGPVELDQAA